MKNLLHPLKAIIIGLSFFIYTTNKAQVTYENQLETIYLNNYTEEMTYANNFSALNNGLIAMGKVNFGSEIKKAKKNKSNLVFLSKRNNIQIHTYNYLKIIRKGANKSTDSKVFIHFVYEKFPELINQFKKDNNLKELYFISRKNTFNGKIDALPFIL
ncbi:hypothetical protein [Aquimarina aquimarini]|uniref:hypothetical protein n=1 Tax=Aquimarina aquimarini TaxID=1191734 RepID=UPI000D55B354|nr:hypothetical protein [Aquimarina aquimarini]